MQKNPESRWQDESRYGNTESVGILVNRQPDSRPFANAALGLFQREQANPQNLFRQAPVMKSTVLDSEHPVAISPKAGLSHIADFWLMVYALALLN